MKRVSITNKDTSTHITGYARGRKIGKKEKTESLFPWTSSLRVSPALTWLSGHGTALCTEICDQWGKKPVLFPCCPCWVLICTGVNEDPRGKALVTGSTIQHSLLQELSPALPWLHIVQTLKSSCQSHSIFFPPSCQVHLLPRALALPLPELLVAFILLFLLVFEVCDAFLPQHHKECLILLISGGWTLLVRDLQGLGHILLLCLAPDSGAADTWGGWRHGRDIVAALQPHLWQVSRLLLFYILAAATFVGHCSKSKLPSQASQIWIFSQKQTFENTTPPAISNCCKVQTHPSSSRNKGKWHKNVKNHTWAMLMGSSTKPRWTCEPQASFVLSCSDLICAARDLSRSQHHLNSGLAVCECIIQSPAQRLEGTSSGTQRSSEPAGSTLLTLRSTSLSWQPLGFLFFK